MMTGVVVEIDGPSGCAYIQLSGEMVTRTVQASESVLVDLDELGVVAGIELLSLDAVVPFADLISEFHVHSGVVSLLEKLIGAGLAAPVISGGSEGTSVAGSLRGLLSPA